MIPSSSISGSHITIALLCLGLAGCKTDDSTDDEVGNTETDSESGTDDSTESETGTSTADTTGPDDTESSETDSSDTDSTDSTDTETDSTDSTDSTDTTDTETDTTGNPDVCGDMMITGDEICDDGVNDGSYGGCNPDCMSLPAHCGDGNLDEGPEECDDGINGDVADGCLDTCEIPNSCLELHELDPMLPDGVYLIAPEGFIPDPFVATCDMTTDGGGWTLAMRFAPANSQFQFYSQHWTNNTIVNGIVADPVDPSDGKFVAYNALPADEIRGCLEHPQMQTWGCKRYPLPNTATLLDVFSNVQVGSDASMKGLYFAETQNQKLEWLSIQGRTLAESSVPNPAYVEVGINIDDDQSCYDARVRFGLVLNNENTVITLNDAAGFGAQAYYTAACDLGAGVDSPWQTASGFAAGPTSYQTAGQIWVR